MVGYTRSLKQTECSRSFIRVPIKHRSIFPNLGVQFLLKVEDDDLNVHLDAQNRIWSSRFKRMTGFNPHAWIKIEKVDDDHFVIEVMK